ncbi:MAG: RidA family protein [Saprospiraceae bacterium]|nr:RidA family protein [Saprospiraceae bacterium]
MTHARRNPFPDTDKDRHYIWNMLVDRDILAFCEADWSSVDSDFVKEGFMGIDAGKRSNPDSWRLSFPNLKTYQDEWSRQAQAFQAEEWGEDPIEALFRTTTLRDIDIQGDSALVHKKFDGQISRKNGTSDRLNWQTLYRCQKINGQWKIAGFTGYLPYPLGHPTVPEQVIEEPKGAGQHVTAGPYSPVLHVRPGELVVISGQASIAMDGTIVGDTIEEQARVTLENCRNQLSTGGCTLDDVFKVNVYLTDLDMWPRFNEVYKTFFNAPLPARTAVGTALLEGLQVEIEMWAVRRS